MSEYYVLRITKCVSCDGRGKNEEAAYRRNALGYADYTAEETALLQQDSAACLTCKGTGKERKEVPLEEALAALPGKA